MRMPILLYHRVGPPDGSAMDRYTVSPERFAVQMAQLAAEGWRGISLEEFLDPDHSVKDRAAVITFDDGFASNREHAWPVLAQHRFHATTFLVAGEINGTNSWDEAAVPRYPLLSAADVRSTDHSIMTFQCHGATHCSLVDAGFERREFEIRTSRASLASVIGRPVDLFSYPFGAWNRTVRDAVALAGYRAACTCESGRNTPSDDPFSLRRVEILEADIGWRLTAKLRTGRQLDTLTTPQGWRSLLASNLRLFQRRRA
jgi:peptidoglycan/xylan/chitin deacetylase (PgdA/CDA1 family)